jgi:hypothetical protein
VVRVRLSCPSLEEYRSSLASHHAVQGIFIPSGRSRPRAIGSRVHLKIELGDRTLAYTGGAVVVADADTHGRPGLILNLEEVEHGHRPTRALALDPPGPGSSTAPPPVARAPRWAWPSDEIFASPDPAPREPVDPEPADAAGLEEVEAELIEPEPADAAGLEEVEAELIEPEPQPAAEAEAEPSGWTEAAKPAPPPAGTWPALAASSEGTLPRLARARSVLAAIPEPPPVLARARPVLAATPEETPPPHAVPVATPRRLGRALAIVLVAVVVVPGLAGGAAVARQQRRRAAAVEAAFARSVELADERILQGRLALPRGDAALDHLLAAGNVRSDDRRVTARLELLADTFETLAGRALLRGDLDEAAAHLAGALRADPRRDRARAELERVESRRRTRPPQPPAAGHGWGAFR